MKTVKLLKKLCVVLVVLIPGVTKVFGQGKSESNQGQVYGDSTLVEFGATYYNDSTAIELYPDKDTKEIYSIAESRGSDEKRIEHISKIRRKKYAYYITFYDNNTVYLKTNRGVTSIVFVRKEGETRDGALLLNGKVVAQYVNGTVTSSLSIPEDEYKNKVKWAYDSNNLDLRTLKGTK